MAHPHNIYDTDAHFQVDAITRSIIDSSGKSTLMQGDHNSERYTFEIPRYIDGHDLSLCDKIQVHYVNIDATDKTRTSRGQYEIDDLQISETNDDAVTCSWLIDRKATEYAGLLRFLLKFICTDSGTVEYVWQTSVYAGIIILQTIDSETTDNYLEVIENGAY